MSAQNPPLLSGLPTSEPLVLEDRMGKKIVHPVWNSYLSKLHGLVKPLGGNGTTANRPTSGLYVGLMYFDATLGYPVWVKSMAPTVWVNATGGVV